MGSKIRSITSMILILTICLVGPLGTTSEGGGSDTAVELTIIQAVSRIRNEIAPNSHRGPDLFVYPEPIKGGTKIPSWGKIIRVPDDFNQVWFFFADDQAEANWGHDCRYFFVDIQTGRFSIVSALTPPDNWSEMRKLPLEKIKGH